MAGHPDPGQVPLGRKGRLTVVLIPGEGGAHRELRLPFWAAGLLLALAAGLVAGGAFAVARDWSLRSELRLAADQRQADEAVAADLAQGKDALLKVAVLEGRLRELLQYRTRKALLKARPPAPGPSDADVLRLAQDLERAPAAADADVRPGVDALVRAARERESSVREILDYVQDKRTREDSKPSGWPVHGWISSPFGRRVNPVSGKAGFHAGVDIANDPGTPIHCTADGRVAFASWDGGYGKLVIVDHGNGYQTYYGHLSQIRTAAGLRLKKGDVVGLMGATGETTGPHVHYEIRLYGVPVNPIKYMRTDR